MKMKMLTAIAIAFALAANVAVRAAENPAMMEPVKSIYDHYLKIQSSLAQDSLKSIPDEAAAISKAVHADEMKMLPATVATQADALAKAKDLKAARTAFKPLSDSLVKYLADNKVSNGMYHEAYCPMVKASWLQKDKQIKNPYMGKRMLECGELKN
jgi:hypothetical protein